MLLVSSALESYDTGLEVMQDLRVPGQDWTRLYFTLHCNRLLCLITLKYEAGRHERLLELCKRQNMAEIVGKQLMEKASLRCAKYCKALDDPIRASLCLERGFNHENKEMRSMVQELSGAITERAYDLGFPTLIKSSYETENWWSSVVIDKSASFQRTQPWWKKYKLTRREKSSYKVSKATFS